MYSGILWYDGSKLPLSQKIEKAMVHYQQKWGLAANVCFVNPSDYEVCDIAGLEVLAKRTILKSHLWLGRTDEVTIIHADTFTLVGQHEDTK